MTRQFLGALVLCMVPVIAATAQGEPELQLLCTDNSAILDGGPAGPPDVKVRVDLRAHTVALLSDDGRVIMSDSDAQISDRTIKWGVGIYGLNTWKQLGLRNNVSNFEGTIDREAGTAVIHWNREARGFGREFRGRCRLMTQKF